MSFDAKTERLISLKKLSGKAHTSNDKGLANEGLPSGITLATNTIFAETIPTNPTATPYTITGGAVEFLRLPVSFILGSDTPDGRHGFELKLPSDYESNSSNTKKGTYPFKNNQIINITSGSLQLVPPSFAPSYEAKPHYGSIGSGTRIFLLDDRDWNLDYFNGVLFQQDPPGTGDHAQNPTYVEAYVYIGNFLDTSLQASAGDITAVNAGDGLIGGANSGAATLTVGAGLGITVNSNNVAINNSIVATLTGSQFSGNVGIAGDLEVAQYIKHIDDDDTFIQFADDAIGITAGGEQLITISEAGQDIVTIGDGGDVDFRVRTLNDDNILYVEGSTDRIGVGTNSPSSILHIKEAAPTLTFQRENNSNISSIDFLGALGNTANSIMHDSSTNDLVFKTFNGSSVEEILRLGDHYGTSVRQVTILSGTNMPPGTMQPRDTSDIAFFVSGSINSRGSSIRGTSVFGGDVLASGSLFIKSGLTGSLTRLPDGTSYLREGANVSIVTGSSGAITISAAASGDAFKTIAIGQAGKKVRFTGNFGMGSYGTVPSSVILRFSDGTSNHDFSATDAGENVAGNYGNSNQFGAGTDRNANYVVDEIVGKLNSSSLNVNAVALAGNAAEDASFTITHSSNGIVTITEDPNSINSGNFGSSAGFTIVSDISDQAPVVADSVTDTLRLVAGDGISIASSAGTDTITISSNLIVDRRKSVVSITNETNVLTAINTGIDFSIFNYKPERIDVFVNGQMMVSGSNKDYVISPTSSLKFNFKLFVDDTVIVTTV